MYKKVFLRQHVIVYALFLNIGRLNNDLKTVVIISIIINNFVYRLITGTTILQCY